MPESNFGLVRNILTVLVSVLISIGLAEGALRLVFDPVDYLSVQTEADPILNHRIGAGVSGHDDWGFRNQKVPQSTDILAIGDSMTYGIMAKSFESWPRQLEDRTGQQVYSAALGGYGPLHYLHLLKTRAPELNPKSVVVMLYLGNDFMDAYNLAYSNETWESYRQNPDAETLDSSLFLPAQDRKTSFVKRTRNWLARNSVLYRLVTQNALFASVREQELLKRSETAFATEHLGTTIVLDPIKRLRFAQVTDPRIQESLEITKRALNEMATYCTENAIEFQVAIMPVREHVFNTIISDTLTSEQGQAMQELQDSLLNIETWLIDALDADGIDYINLRPLMEQALRDENIYPPTDGHPNAIGYGVVAAELATSFTQ